MTVGLSHKARPPEVATRVGTKRPNARIGVPFWFALPCLALFCFAVVYPAASGVYYAFTDWSGLGSHIHFTGLANFRHMTHDPIARSAIVHTVLMAAVITVGQNVIGLGLALGLNSRVKSRNVLRTILFAPVVMTPLVVGYVWQFIFLPTGPLSSVAQFLGIKGGLNILGDPSTALWGVVATVVWQHTGYSMVIFLAGLQNVPRETLEAASIDGASPWPRFRLIIWPLLRTATLINVTLALIMSFKLFDQVIATTQGGPANSTQTLSTLLLQESVVENHYGYGIALGLIVFLLIAVVGAIQRRLFRGRD